MKIIVYLIAGMLGLLFVVAGGQGNAVVRIAIGAILLGSVSVCGNQAASL